MQERTTNIIISVLVPIYNVIQYLDKCLNSLCQQKIKGAEFILLDDGSTDGCSAICDQFAQKDSRFVVVHKENSGYGATLNYGLSIAKGKYIGILESDDWIEGQMYEEMCNIAEKESADIVKSNFYIEDIHKGKSLQKLSFNSDIYSICPSEDTRIFYFQCAIWNAIYNKNFLCSNGINFLNTPGASFQDTSFNFKTLLLAKKLVYTQNAFVHYRCGHGSSVTAQNKVFCITEEWKECEKFIKTKHISYSKLSHLINNLKFRDYIWNLQRLQINSPEYQSFIKFIQKQLDTKKLQLPTLKNNVTILTPDKKYRILYSIYNKKIYLLKEFLYQHLKWLYKERLNLEIKTYIIMGIKFKYKLKYFSLK